MLDPENIAGRATAYDRLLMLYWVNMKLIAYSSLRATTKWEGDGEPVRVWKEHNSYCRLMHRKIDLMDTKMGIQLFHRRMEQAKV